jgi:predicted NAD-dependent protein-ADP-ribosyltransferase YbiA (DUF1768 family)
MSDDEGDDVVTGLLTGNYRQFHHGDPVLLFKADKAIPLCYLSNLAVVQSGVQHNGITYPTVEHAFQAQKFHESVRHLFSTSGVYGNPANQFQAGWTAYFQAKTPTSKTIAETVERKQKWWGKKNQFGVLAKMVNNLTKPTKNGTSKIDRLGLRPNPAWDFGESHERLWMSLLRSKFQDPLMRNYLLETGDAYLIEYQKHEKEKNTDRDHVDFYTAYYNETTGECKHCNEPRCNAIGKFLMKIRDELRGTRPPSPGRPPSPSTRRSSPGGPPSPGARPSSHRPPSPPTRRVSPGARLPPPTRRVSPGARPPSPGLRQPSPPTRRNSPGARPASPQRNYIEIDLTSDDDEPAPKRPKNVIVID